MADPSASVNCLQLPSFSEWTPLFVPFNVRQATERIYYNQQFCNSIIARSDT